MARLQNTGDMIARMFVGPDRNIVHSNVLRSLVDEFGLDDGRAQPVLEEVSTAVELAAAAFELDPDSLATYEEIKTSSVGKMIELAAEMEAGFRNYQAQAEAARRALAELEARHREVSRQAAYDELTDVLSRGEFMRRLEAETGRAASRELPLALLFLDIDHFKWVNDRLGHLAGDTVLMSFGAYLGHGLRRLDSAGRYGGDEFLVLLIESELAVALDVARRLRSRIASLSRGWLEDFDGITVSIGLAHVEAVGADIAPTTLLQEADQCLYTAKMEGRNCIRYCSL
jgi:diguanylate cyclase (GGDEF)-like protein